jgi:hypothetical protein
LGVGLHRTGFVQETARGFGDAVDNFADRIDIDFAGVGIDASAQFFVRFEVLARSDFIASSIA